MVSVQFTSALYLGLGHPSSRLPAWSRLTLGMPAALREPLAAREVADRFALLVGAEAATAAPSTLHVTFDLFPLVAPRGAIVYVDAGTYPISRWGIERAVARGARVRPFASHQVDALRRALREQRSTHPPIIACDAVCAACGRIAPLAEYHHLAAEHGGLLVIDESQAIGVLGYSPDRSDPYGHAGGGAAVQQRLSGERVVRFASLAKGLGAPVALLAGANALIDAFRARAETRVHCSPPSMANLLAARRGLAINVARGDDLRRRLADRVLRFRRLLTHTGLLHSTTAFPVQTLRLPVGDDPSNVVHRLATHGVRATLTRDERGQPLLTFVFTAAHSIEDVDRAASVVRATVRPSVRRAS